MNTCSKLVRQNDLSGCVHLLACTHMSAFVYHVTYAACHRLAGVDLSSNCAGDAECVGIPFHHLAMVDFASNCTG